jgi:hypothetical protein
VHIVQQEDAFIQVGNQLVDLFAGESAVSNLDTFQTV